MTFKWTEELILQLKNLVKKGLSDSEISNQLNVTKGSIKSKRRRLFISKKSGSFVDLGIDQKIKISKQRNQQYRLKYRSKNPVVTKIREKLYTNKRRNLLAINFKKESREDYWNYRLSNIKRNVKKRGIKFNLSVVDLELQWKKQKGKCFYSDIDLKPHVTDNTFVNKNNLISIDRIDPKKGYEKNNIQFVSYAINTAKQELSHLEFINICKYISKKF